MSQPDPLVERLRGVACICGRPYDEHPWSALDEGCDEWSPHPGSLAAAVRQWIEERLPAKRGREWDVHAANQNIGYNAALADMRRTGGAMTLREEINKVIKGVKWQSEIGPGIERVLARRLDPEALARVIRRQDTAQPWASFVADQALGRINNADEAYFGALATAVLAHIMGGGQNDKNWIP